MTSSTPDPLLGVRAAVVILFAFVVGAGAGVLSYLDDPSISSAVLVGGGAFGGALLLFHNIVGRR